MKTSDNDLKVNAIAIQKEYFCSSCSSKRQVGYALAPCVPFSSVPCISNCNVICLCYCKSTLYCVKTIQQLPLLLYVLTLLNTSKAKLFFTMKYTTSRQDHSQQNNWSLKEYNRIYHITTKPFTIHNWSR